MKTLWILALAFCLTGQVLCQPPKPKPFVKKLFSLRTAVMVGSIVSLGTNIKQNTDVFDNPKTKPEPMKVAQIRLGINSAALAGSVGAFVFTMATHPKPTSDQKRILALELENADLNRRLAALEKKKE